MSRKDTFQGRRHEKQPGKHAHNSSLSGALGRFSYFKMPADNGFSEATLASTSFVDMAESSTGGGGGISRPYGTFVAARRGDGCALWQRLPAAQDAAANRRRYDFFPGSVMPTTPNPLTQHAFDHSNMGKNVSAMNIAKRLYLSRRGREGGVYIRSNTSYQGRDKVLGDEEHEETAKFTQPRGSSLCPPQCKPGCWMCFRKAENMRETFTFLTEVTGNERPPPTPTIFDRFGRALPAQPPAFEAGYPEPTDAAGFSTRLAGGTAKLDFSNYQLPPEYANVGVRSQEEMPPNTATSEFKQRLGASILETTMRRTKSGLPRAQGGSVKLPVERSLPTPNSRGNSGRSNPRY